MVKNMTFKYPKYDWTKKEVFKEKNKFITPKLYKVIEDKSCFKLIFIPKIKYQKEVKK